MHSEVEAFYNGTSFGCHRLLGARPAGHGWRFTVWAPHARRVQVLGDWNGWDLYTAAELAACEDGLWRGTVPAAAEGQLYKYNLLGPDGVWRMRPDLFARDGEALPGTASRLTLPPAPPPRRGALGRPVRLYELYAAGWRRHWDGRYYTGEELGRALAPYLLENGYTDVELMPLAEYPYDGSWGYQGCGYFCPSARIGGPRGMAALVGALHRAGIGVWMDFVPVHFAPDAGRMAEWDGAPMLEAGPSDWGSLRFDLASGPVRSFLQSAAAFWLEEMGCDGLRVDAVGHALQGPGGRAAAGFFAGLTDGLHRRCPGVLLAAEDTAGLAGVTQPAAAGGLGFDAVWDTGWTRDALACLSAPPGSGAGRDAFARLCGGRWRSDAILPLSHDDTAGPSLWQRLAGSGDAQRAARLLYLLQYTRPGRPLNFMGNEFGCPAPFTPFREPDWAAAAAPPHRDLAAFCRALNALHAAHPALRDPGSGFVPLRQDPDARLLAYERQAGTDRLVVACNLGGADARLPVAAGGAGRGRLVFAAGPVPEGDLPVTDGRLAIRLPPFCGAVYQLT